MMDIVKALRWVLLGMTVFVAIPWPAHSDLPQSSVEYNDLSAGFSRCRSYLEASFVRSLDMQRYGLVGDRKYLDLATLELALSFSRPASSEVDKWVDGTLSAHTALIDTAVGGAYDYSLGGDWKRPCHTKTLARHNAVIALYASAYRARGIDEYLSIAERSVDYVEKFLKARSGYYFTSRGSCNLESRFGAEEQRATDPHVPSGEAIAKDERVSLVDNANFVLVLAELYAVSTRERFKDLALLNARKLKGDPEVHELLDRVAMARALYSLYSITGDATWLDDSIAALNKVIDERGGFAENLDKKAPLSSRIEAATALARLSNMIYATTREARYRDVAKQALDAALPRRCEQASVVDAARLLLAEAELRTEPPHAVLIENGDDSGSEKLWQVMLWKLPSYVKRERFPSVLALRSGSDRLYPELSKPAVFLCSKKRCSVPILTPAELTERIAEMVVRY